MSLQVTSNRSAGGTRLPTQTPPRVSSEQFRIAFEQAPIGMAFCSPDGQWLHVNQALCQTLGYDLHELMRLPVRQVTHPEDLPAEQLLWAADDENPTRSVRFFHRRGHVVWTECSGCVVPGAGGQSESLLFHVQDVTARKKAEWLNADRGQFLKMVAQHRPLDEAFCTLARLVERQIEGAKVSVMRLYEGEIYQTAPSLPPEFLRRVEPRNIGIAAGLASGVADPPDSVGCCDIATDSTWEGFRDTAAVHGLAGCWSVRVLSSENIPLGMLVCYWPQPSRPQPDEERMLAAAARLAAVAIEHHDTTRQLAHFVRHDPLTGVANRILFQDRVQQALAMARRHGNLVGLLLLDLDHFKSINDTLGHQAGDSLLQQVAQRLRSRLRETDTLARVGGDEFVLILPQIKAPDDAANVARKLLDAIANPFTIAGREVKVTGSIGVAVFPRDGDDAVALQARADAAMYVAKERGRNGVAVAAGR